MSKQERQSILCLTAAVIGAGFATGKELAVSFARFGEHGALAVLGAALTLCGLCWALLRRAEGLHAACVEQLCTGRLRAMTRCCFLVLMTVTGGAMLAGAADVAALLLPVPGAWWIGWAVTLALGCLCCRRSLGILTWLGGGLALCLLCILALGLALPAYPAARLAEAGPDWLTALDGLLHGCCWAGFNLAFASPILCETAGKLSPRQRCRVAVGFGVLVSGLIALGVALLQKHPLLLEAEMPFIRLLTAFGRRGYLLGACGLYLAILTTLLSALRGFAALTGAAGSRSVLLAGAAAALLSAMGFEGLVRWAYPPVGAVCLLLLIAVLCRSRRSSTQI